MHVGPFGVVVVRFQLREQASRSSRPPSRGRGFTPSESHDAGSGAKVDGRGGSGSPGADDGSGVNPASPHLSAVDGGGTRRNFRGRTRGIAINVSKANDLTVENNFSPPASPVRRHTRATTHPDQLRCKERQWLGNRL
eukprot:INCI14704.8.p2 GENE.INCI14704.8~~INCI14704.8.p2  ORF type:complete len:138 (+),score=2.99 INCI14704.8:155-568(+)